VEPLAEYRLLKTTKELSSFVTGWRRLWARDPRSLPFQSPAWLLPWWRQFGSGELCAIVINRRGEDIGLLPFYVYRDSANDKRQVLPLGVGPTDYLDGIFASECSLDEIRGAVEVLRKTVKHDELCITQLPAHSRLLMAMQQGSGIGGPGAGDRQYRLASKSGAGDSSEKIYVTQSDGCSRMAAVPWANLPQKIRRNATYYRNRAQRGGKLELIQADGSNWAVVFERLHHLHTLRWRQRGEDGVLTDERVLEWHREAIPMLLEARLLRLMALKLNNEIIAVLYSLIDPVRDERAQYFYITAYSPKHAELRPGTLLIAYAVEHAANEGVSIIDMLRGEEDYKQIWHMDKTPTWCLTQLAPRDAEEKREAAA